SRLRLSQGSISILAVLSAAFAIVGASARTGSAYHAIAFGHVENLNQFCVVGAIFAASTIALMKANDLYTPDRVLLFRPPVPLLITIWTGVVLFLLGIFFALKVI